MDDSNIKTGSSMTEDESIVGFESIVSEEDLQLIDEEEDGEVIDEINKPAQNEDELDYEEEENESMEEGEEDSDRNEINKDEDEDGEVNSDDDLEEGEVKDDGDEDEEEVGPDGVQKKGSKKNQSQSKTNVCRFFAKGQCTWGNNCRFLHLSQPVPPLKVGPQRPFTFTPQTVPPPPRPFRPPEEFCDHPPIFPHLAPPIPRHPPPPPHITPPLLPPPSPLPPAQAPTGAAESAWERGLRHAKEMIVKASKRKEEEIDFDDKRFNAGVVDDEVTSHSRHSHHSKNSEDSYSYEGSPRSGRSPSHNYNPRDKERHSNRDEYWNSEYERRRRLAFESAPWNDDQALPLRNAKRNREAAEHYRDPWRRSKSPPGKWNAGRREMEGSAAGKRSHSMSSISGSDSGSEISGSDSFSRSDDSFSGSDSIYSDATDLSGRSPRGRKGRLRHRDRPTGNVKTKSRPLHPPHPPKDKPLPKPSSIRDRAQAHITSKSRSSRSSLDDEASNTGLNKKMRVIPPPLPPPPSSKPRRDSWSDSDSNSISRSGSSMYSGSESGDSDAFSMESELEEERKLKNMRSKETVKPYSSQPLSNQPVSRRSKTKLSPSPVSEISGPSKKAKMSVNMTTSNKIEKQPNFKNRHASPPISFKISSSPSSPLTKKVAHSPNSQNEAPQKKPIKMTFKKKHPNLKKDRNVTAKLNGSRGESEEEEEQTNPGRRSPTPDILSEDSSRKEETKMMFKEVTPTDSKQAIKSSGSAKVSSTTDGSSSSRREDLLKQLKAVEAAIAKKRAKLH